MESVAPPLELVMALKSSLESGDSLRVGLVQYLRRSKSLFAEDVARWLVTFDRGGDIEGILSEIQSPYRRAILRICGQGLRGQSVLPSLKEIEEELKDATERELQSFISMLPIKLLLPLLLFQFPAYMILLLGPLLRRFLGSFV